MKYGKLFLTGTVFNIATFFVIAPVYSMFLWIYMIMALGYIRYQNEKKVFDFLKIWLLHENRNRLQVHR